MFTYAHVRPLQSHVTAPEVRAPEVTAPAPGRRPRGRLLLVGLLALPALWASASPASAAAGTTAAADTSAAMGTVKPSAATTGVPAGTKLKPYFGNITVTTPGARFDSLDVHGFIDVRAPNVTISRSIVRGGRATRDIGLIENDSATATNLVVSDTELVPDFPSVWIDAIKGFNYSLRRVDAHGTVDLAKVYGPNVTIEGSWLHDTRYYRSDPNQGGGPTHNDGVQVLSGTNVHVSGNWIYGGSNSALQVTQDAGHVSGLVFDHNWVDGGNCTVNLQDKPMSSLSTVSLVGNRFGHNTRYANCAVIEQRGVRLAASGNVWDDTGRPIQVRQG